LDGPSDCDDERYSEFDNESLAVDIVTVEDPEELFITILWTDPQNVLRNKLADDLTAFGASALALSATSVIWGVALSLSCVEIV
jgi:hypothetical protein